MFDWNVDSNNDSNACEITDIETVSRFSMGTRNGIATKQQNMNGRGNMIITNGEWVDGKLNGQNVHISLEWRNKKSKDENIKRFMIANFNNNIPECGSIYFKSCSKRYKFCFKNIEISEIHEFRPQKIRFSMANQLCYYRSIIFGLKPESGIDNSNSMSNTIIINNKKNNNINIGAQLYSEDNQCFKGQFIVSMRRKASFSNDASFVKQDLCALYLLLHDLLRCIVNVQLFDGIIKFNSFDGDSGCNYQENTTTQKEKQQKEVCTEEKAEKAENADKQEKEHCPLKYKFRIKSELEALKSTPEKLESQLYINPNEDKNRMATQFVNNPKIQQMKIPVPKSNTTGMIKLSAKIIRESDHKHCSNDQFLNHFNCWSTQLIFLPTSYVEMKTMMNQEKDVVELTKNINNNGHCNENDNNENNYHKKLDCFRNDGFVVHYNGRCTLKSSILYRMPFVFDDWGIIFVQYKDVIDNKFLKSVVLKSVVKQLETETNNEEQEQEKEKEKGLQVNSINGEKYLVKIQCCCRKSRIDEASLLQQITLNMKDNEKIANDILRLRSLHTYLDCHTFDVATGGEHYSYEKAVTILQTITRLQQEFRRELEMKKITKENAEMEESLIVPYQQVSSVLTKIGFHPCDEFIAKQCANIYTHSSRHKILSLLYGTQCYQLISKCMKIFYDNGKDSWNRYSYVCKTDSTKWNIFHYAAYLNDVKYIEICQKLFNREYGHYCHRLRSEKDKYNNTPLHIAAQYGNVDVLNQFIGIDKSHANRMIVLGPVLNDDGFTPIDLAIINDHKNCFIQLNKCLNTFGRHSNTKGIIQGFTNATLAAENESWDVLNYIAEQNWIDWNENNREYNSLVDWLKLQINDQNSSLDQVIALYQQKCPNFYQKWIENQEN